MSSINTNSQHELIARIKELEEEVRKLKSRKKYGLIWEDKPEDVVLECEKKIPVLKEIKSRKIVTSEDSPTNLLIEGDNYHALSVLNYTHRGKIDVIYIDPPYNTENKDFIYNDNYIDKEDSFRHSKWLSFIEKRLTLSKSLLKESGIIFISIDDNEQSQLKLLCDSIFGQSNFVSNFIIDKTAQGANQSSTFKTQHEYCLLYKNVTSENINYDQPQEDNLKKYKYKDSKGYYAITNSFDSINSPLSDNKNRGYTVYYNENKKDAVIKDEYDRDQNSFLSFDKNLISKGYTPIRPGIRNGIQYPWNWTPSRFLSDYKEELVFMKNKKGVLNIYHKNRSTGVVKDVTIKRFDTRQFGNQLLAEIIGEKRFDYPKSLDMLKWVISKNKNKFSTVLDFMAGSGTSGHAVMELNKEDGGNRQFILCTNNENNICEEVTYERLKRVIKGYENKKGEKVDGLGGNLEYFKCEFVDKTRHTDNMKMRLMRACTEMLCLKENTFDMLKEFKDEETLIYRIYKGIKVSDNGENKKHIVGIYYDLDDSYLEDMRNDLKSYEDAHKTAYIFSLRNVADFIDDYRKWKGIHIEEVPQKILEIYESIYKRNNRT